MHSLQHSCFEASATASLQGTCGSVQQRGSDMPSFQERALLQLCERTPNVHVRSFFFLCLPVEKHTSRIGAISPLVPACSPRGLLQVRPPSGVEHPSVWPQVWDPSSATALSALLEKSFCFFTRFLGVVGGAFQCFPRWRLPPVGAPLAPLSVRDDSFLRLPDGMGTGSGRSLSCQSSS